MEHEVPARRDCARCGDDPHWHQPATHHAGRCLARVRAAICAGADRGPRTLGLRSGRIDYPQPGGVAERDAVVTIHPLHVGTRAVVDHPLLPTWHRYHASPAAGERAPGSGVCAAQRGATACYPPAPLGNESRHDGRVILNIDPGLLLVIEKAPGANTLEVTQGIEAKLDELRPGLSGIQVDTSIFRPASFVEMAVGNLTNALFIGFLLVALALYLFLFSWRTALISLVAIPLSLLAAGLALVPLAISGAIPGHEIAHPMAIVILGGLVTSTILNLFIVPSLYLRFGKSKEERKKALFSQRPAASAPAEENA